MNRLLALVQQVGNRSDARRELSAVQAESSAKDGHSRLVAREIGHGQEEGQADPRRSEQPRA